MIPGRELDRVMIPERISGKSENGGLGELSRGCITIESCTKWKKEEKGMNGEELKSKKYSKFG